ncbi:MAG: DUF222 domain-containing protein [Candidatus Nanopelagicales bacterium]
MADSWDDITPAGNTAWESLPPGPRLAQALADVDPESLSDSARVSYLQATDRLIGWAHVRQARALVAVADAVESATSPGPGMTSSHQSSWVADEVAAALHIAPRTATMRVNGAHAIVRDWPRLGVEVTAGRITPAQAREIYEGVSVLSGHVDADGVDLSERAVAGLVRIAPSLPPARLRERVARMVASLDPEAAARRRRASARDLTDVVVWPESDGLACLAARGPAADALAMRDLIDARARVLKEAAPDADDRTLGQWRHAALMAAFGLTPVGAPPTVTPSAWANEDSRATGLETPTGAHRVTDPVRAQIRVTVPLDTLLGLAETPGELEGYGPLDPELARALAADGDWIRWITDSAGDYLIDEGRRRFPGRRLARFLRSRERRCKHPSCGVRSHRADADHLPAYADGGRTSAAGMSPTCPRHNRHRDASHWQVEVDGPRDPSAPPDPTWISPLGRRYETGTPRPLVTDYVPRRT